jgi:hypothetical protein
MNHSLKNDIYVSKTVVQSKNIFYFAKREATRMALQQQSWRIFSKQQIWLCDHLTRYAACLCIRLSIVTIADEHKPHFTHNEWMIQNCGFYVCCRIRRWHPHFGPWQFVHQLWLTISPWICWDISARCLANLFAGVVTPNTFHFFYT